MTKVIDLIIEIHSFEHQCVIMKGLLQPKQLKQYIVTIGVYQSSRNSAIYEHRCLENIKNLCKSSGKHDDQQQYKAILEAAMVSTTEIFTDNSPISSTQYGTLKKSSARKPLRQFLELLDVKHGTVLHMFCAAK